MTDICDIAEAKMEMLQTLVRLAADDAAENIRAGKNADAMIAHLRAETGRLMEAARSIQKEIRAQRKGRR